MVYIVHGTDVVETDGTEVFFLVNGLPGRLHRGIGTEEREFKLEVDIGDNVVVVMRQKAGGTTAQVNIGIGGKNPLVNKQYSAYDGPGVILRSMQFSVLQGWVLTPGKFDVREFVVKPQEQGVAAQTGGERLGQIQVSIVPEDNQRSSGGWDPRTFEGQEELLITQPVPKNSPRVTRSSPETTDDPQYGPLGIGAGDKIVNRPIEIGTLQDRNIHYRHMPGGGEFTIELVPTSDHVTSAPTGYDSVL